MALQTDEEIITLYKNGDENAFKILIDRYTNPLYNFTARLTNKNDANDIVADVFIKVWKNIKNFDASKASFKTWVFTITKNTATDFLRKKRDLLYSDFEQYGNEENNSFVEKIPDENLLPDEALQKLQDIELFNKLLDNLSLDHKTVLILHYQEELTFDEISKILNKSLNTVKSQHRRALAKLRNIII